jgi:dTDP-glucose 4,6-dehydratase
MKLLITGSAGFIMGNFVRKVIYEKLPYQVVSIDRVRSGANGTNSLYWNKNHEFYPADIRDQHILNMIFQFEKPDIVVHGAAESFEDQSISNPNDFMSSNVIGTQNIINACLKHEVKRLVYLSIDEIYGTLLNENDSSWKEEDKWNPRNPYSASKASGELLILAAAQTHGLKYNITRSSNNYGPRQTMDKLIPKVLSCIFNNEKIPIYGNGSQMREWTHVFDNCSAIVKILEGPENEIYNISSNHELTNLELVQKICNATNSHHLISFVEDRKGHDFRYSVNTDKLKALGWEPKMKFKEGLQQTIDWYSSNKWMLR